MKRLLLPVFFFIAQSCFCQQGWQVEIMSGIATYKGDLTQSEFPIGNVGPLASLHMKYDFGDMITLRGGIAWAKISGDDQKNKNKDIKRRNINFKSSVIDLSLVAEVNLLDPEYYYVYPYLLAGVGAFHFDPYSYDKDNKKTYLRPLSTEGQGLPEYPMRKEYALTQFYLPFGGGIKLKLKNNYIVSFESTVHFLFTDYIDDVSTTYVDPGILLARKGPKAVEMSIKQTSPFPTAGEQRGNPGVKDLYFFTGFKLAIPLARQKLQVKKADNSTL